MSKPFCVRIFIQGEDVFYRDVEAKDAYDALKRAATEALKRDLSYIKGGEIWVKSNHKREG